MSDSNANESVYSAHFLDGAANQYLPFDFGAKDLFHRNVGTPQSSPGADRQNAQQDASSDVNGIVGCM
jgi:hypothetical protein